MAALEKENKLQEAQIQAAKKSGKSGKRGKYVAKIPMNVDFEKNYEAMWRTRPNSLANHQISEH